MTTIVEWSAADQVTDEVSFLAILKRLARDREDEVRKEVATPSHPMCPGANGWENGSIETYLDAAHAWGDVSIDGDPFYEPLTNPWTRVAQILLAGKYYQ